jgi:hypothetical protein
MLCCLGGGSFELHTNTMIAEIIGVDNNYYSCFICGDNLLVGDEYIFTTGDDLCGRIRIHTRCIEDE